MIIAYTAESKEKMKNEKIEDGNTAINADIRNYVNRLCYGYLNHIHFLDRNL